MLRGKPFYISATTQPSPQFSTTQLSQVKLEDAELN